MKRKFWTRQFPLALLISGGLAIALAWQNHPGKSTATTTDTIPERSKKIRDIDDVLEEIEKSRVEMDKSLKDMDWQKMQQDINASIQKIDVNKMQAEIQEAMKDLDTRQIQLEVQKALKEADLQHIQENVQKELSALQSQQLKEEVNKAMKDIDMAKIRATLDASLARIDMEKMKTELERIKTIDMKKMQENLERIKPEIEKSMAGARESLDKAKKEVSAYKDFIADLDRDGLINKKESYTIQYKNGELSINGKKQSSELTQRYNMFLKDKKDFTITKDENHFDIGKD